MAADTSQPHYGYVHVVHNPAAGLSTSFDAGREIVQHMAAMADCVTLCQTAERSAVVSSVRTALAGGADLCVAVGGDGTVSWTADALARSTVSLGIVPTGTGNVLARELGIPLDMQGALELLDGPHTLRRIDAMQVVDAYYLLNVSAGFSAQLMHGTSPGRKRQLGMLAYVLTALQQLSGLRLQRFTLYVNGRRLRVRASEVAVVNASTIGRQRLRWAPDIALDDGQLELCILRAATAFDLARVFVHALMGRQRFDPALRIIPITGGVTIVTRRDMPIQADGDVIGYSPVHVVLVRRALSIIVPQPATHSG